MSHVLFIWVTQTTLWILGVDGAHDHAYISVRIFFVNTQVILSWSFLYAVICFPLRTSHPIWHATLFQRQIDVTFNQRCSNTCDVDTTLFQRCAPNTHPSCLLYRLTLRIWWLSILISWSCLYVVFQHRVIISLKKLSFITRLLVYITRIYIYAQNNYIVKWLWVTSLVTHNFWVTSEERTEENVKGNN